MTVRAKFRVTEVAQTLNGVKLKASPVYSQDPKSENSAFWEASPSGEFWVEGTKPDIFNGFVPGDMIYIDVTKAPPA